jgi:hypothetical protein
MHDLCHSKFNAESTKEALIRTKTGAKENMSDKKFLSFPRRRKSMLPIFFCKARILDRVEEGGNSSCPAQT